MSDFRTESHYIKISLFDQDGNDVGITPVQSVELILYAEGTGDVWLRYAYPSKTVEGQTWHPITKHAETHFSAEITPALSASAPLGRIVAQVTYNITDADFATGKKQIVEKGIIYINKPVAQ